MKIQVYKKCKKHYRPEPEKNSCCEFIETIDRKVYNRGMVGNFVPHFCRYRKEEHLVLGSIDYSYMHGYDDDAYIAV